MKPGELRLIWLALCFTRLHLATVYYVTFAVTRDHVTPWSAIWHGRPLAFGICICISTDVWPDHMIYVQSSSLVTMPLPRIYWIQQRDYEFPAFRLPFNELSCKSVSDMCFYLLLLCSHFCTVFLFPVMKPLENFLLEQKGLLTDEKLASLTVKTNTKQMFEDTFENSYSWIMPWFCWSVV